MALSRKLYQQVIDDRRNLFGLRKDNIDESQRVKGLLPKLAEESPAELERRSIESMKWYVGRMRKLKVNTDKFYKQSVMPRTRRYLEGRMYNFFYDPIGEETLPYYDRFPLVLCMHIFPDRMMGLNLHYIQPRYRLILLDELFKYVNNTDYDERTRFRVTYPILKSASKLRWGRPCFKTYLFSQVHGNALEIETEYWDIVSFLPTAQFMKKNIRSVYRDTLEKAKT